MSSQRVFGVLLLSLFAVAVCGQNSNGGSQHNVTVAAPLGCKVGQCKLNLTIIRDGEKGDFLVSLDAEAEGYVAVAFAGAGMMGNDTVIECVKQDAQSSLKFYHSVNGGPASASGRKTVRDAQQMIDKVAKDANGKWEGSRISCSFRLSPFTTFAGGRTLDLERKSYYLQIASGDSVKESGVEKHDKWATTLRAVSVAKDEARYRTVDSFLEPKKSSAHALTISGYLTCAMLILRLYL